MAVVVARQPQRLRRRSKASAATSYPSPAMAAGVEVGVGVQEVFRGTGECILESGVKNNQFRELSWRFQLVAPVEAAIRGGHSVTTS